MWWCCAVALAADAQGEIADAWTAELTARLPVHQVSPLTRPEPLPVAPPEGRAYRVHVESLTRGEIITRGFLHRVPTGRTYVAATVPVRTAEADAGTWVFTRDRVMRRFELQKEAICVDCEERPWLPRIDVLEALPTGHDVTGLLSRVPGVYVTDAGVWSGGGPMAIQVDGVAWR